VTPEQLQALLAAGETLDVEFKGEARAPLSDDDLVDSVVCLANRTGGGSGWLLVGVEDDGAASGARPRHGDRTDPARVQALIEARTRPSASTAVSLVPMGDRAVLAIRVERSATPLGSTRGLFTRRTIDPRGRPICVPITYSDMTALQSSRGALDFSQLVLPEATWDDLDPVEFDRFRRYVVEGGGDSALVELSNLDLAKALGAVDANHDVRAVRLLAVLLFGKESALRRFVPAHSVALQELDGETVRVNRFFSWPLLRLLDEATAFLRARIREDEALVGFTRLALPDFAYPALREGLVNALVHRDYARLAAVHVQWRDDGVEISSPGGFPEGVGLNNLLSTAPRPRNPRLAEAMSRAGIVERTGRGIDSIVAGQIRAGRPTPTYESSDLASVVLFFPRGRAVVGLARLAAVPTTGGRVRPAEELLVLRALVERGPQDAATLARAAEAGERSTQIALRQLEESGLVVEAQGRWSLSQRATALRREVEPA
jgi:ATP-dependent DNA helicase RecG